MRPSLFLLLFPFGLAAAAPLKKRCTFVDDGFVAKDCGYSPTEEEFAEFLAKQAAEVAELAQTHPCGFTSCSRRFKRDIHFRYSLPDQPVVRKRQAELSLRSRPPLDSDSEGANIVNSSQTVNPSSFQRDEPSVSKFVTSQKDVVLLSDTHLVEPEINTSPEDLDAEAPGQDRPIMNWQKGPPVSGHEALRFNREKTVPDNYGSQHLLNIANGDESCLVSATRFFSHYAPQSENSKGFFSHGTKKSHLKSASKLDVGLLANL